MGLFLWLDDFYIFYTHPYYILGISPPWLFCYFHSRIGLYYSFLYSGSTYFLNIQFRLCASKPLDLKNIKSLMPVILIAVGWLMFFQRSIMGLVSPANLDRWKYMLEVVDYSSMNFLPFQAFTYTNGID